MGEIEALFTYEAVELALSSPGFSAFFLLVTKASRSWRPLMDLSSLNSRFLCLVFGWKHLIPFFSLSRGSLGCSSASRMCISRFLFIPTIVSFLWFVVVGMFSSSRSVLRSLLGP